MFEKIITAILGFFLTLGGWTGQSISKLQPVALVTSPTISQEINFPGERIDVSSDLETYILWMMEIPPSASLKLIPNFTQREDAETIAKANNCEIAINGGFYLSEGKPLGLFVTDGQTYGEEIQSNLATGFVWQERGGSLFIHLDKPLDLQALDFILQTGPYIVVGERKLKLVDDEPARRSLVTQTREKKLFAVVVTEKENTLSGPLLADIPVILSRPEVKKVIDFETAINLDGGSASFFYAKQFGNPFVFSELKSVGSLLCVTTP